jgi:hypothetical protein
MPKTKISEYASTATGAVLNTDIAGIDINEGCAPSGINNAIRTLMSQIKDLQSGASGDSVALTAGGTGSTTAAGARTNLGAAASGANSDITALSGLTTTITLVQGGTGALRSSVSNVSRTSNVATITTSSAHGYTANDIVTVSGVTTAGFNASKVSIIATPSSTTFTYSNTGSDVGSTADTTGLVINLTSVSTNLNVQQYDANTVKSNVATTFTRQQVGGDVTLTDAATIAWDVSSAQVATVTITDNRTFGAPTNMVNGGFYALAVIQDATGSRTLTWNSVFKWYNGEAPTISETANAKDFFVFRSDGTNMYEQGRSLGVA